MLPECKQSPEVSGNQATPLVERTLLERMGLENQTLMMRLGLPLKTSWDLAQGTSLPPDLGTRIKVPSSNVPVMMKGMTVEIMPGTGRNLVEGPCGMMSRMQSCQLPKKLTSSRTPTLLTSNERSKVWNPSRIAWIFPLSSGKTSEDQFSRVTAYDEVIDLGDNFEISTKQAGKSKSKITSDLDWFYAWTKYSMAVLWAYPHRQNELTHYGQHIIGQFMAGLNPHHNVEYDQAARKFFHGHQELSFTDTNQLANLANQIFMPRKYQGGAWGGDGNIASSSQSGGHGRNKRK